MHNAEPACPNFYTPEMGQVYYDMDFLATAEVVECSAKDLIGEYVGQTGPKAQKLIESALGKVLFIDEAYLLGDTLFARKAADELVDSITKTQFQSKLVIILAGYADEINRLMDVNPGLSSRFTESVDFQTLKPDECLELLSVSLGRKTQIDASVLTTPSSSFRQHALEKFAELSLLANFANGRDNQILSKKILGVVMKTRQPENASLAVTEDLVISHICALIAERASRAQSAVQVPAPWIDERPLPVRTETKEQSQSPQATVRATSHATKQQAGALPDQSAPSDSDDDGSPDDETPSHPPAAVRDAGFSDEVWAQLQQDKMKAEQEEREKERLVREEEELGRWLEMFAVATRQRVLEEIERKRRELEEKLREEAEAKQKLKRLGKCSVRFEWTRQSGGYLCAGALHWITDGQMEKMRGRE